jgi:hypothetical protein
MRLDTESFPLSITPKLKNILEEEIGVADVPVGKGLLLTFEEPNESPAKECYHPVEVALEADGKILHITDYAYIGRSPYEERIQFLDFDASADLFKHAPMVFPLEEGAEDFVRWQHAFCVHYRMGVFRVRIVPM